MAVSLPAVGVTSYNGFTFPVETESSVDGQPVLDRAQRTVMYVIWRINIKALIANSPASSTDTNLDSIRSQLTTPGGALSFTSKGFGNLDVNTGGAKTDACWGPIPKILRWKPVGSNNACEIEWQCEVAIPQCTTGTTTYSLALAGLSFTTAFTVDLFGYTTRTIDGQLEIPMTRIAVTNRSIPDIADNYYVQIVPPIPPNFRRVTQFRELDESERILHFRFIDEEIPPQPLQTGVIACQASHVIQSTGQSIYGRYTNTVSATYTMAKEVPRGKAIEAFSALVLQRAQLAAAGGALAILPVSLTMEEPDIFGKTSARLSFSWTETVTLQQLLVQSGLWQPVAGTTYAAWLASMSVVMSPRGEAGLQALPSDQLIIDLCQSNAAAVNTNSLTTLNMPYQSSFVTLPILVPTPDASYLRAEMRVIVEGDGRTVSMKSLPTGVLPTSGNSPGYTSSFTSSGSIFPDLPNIDTVKDIVQARTSPKVRIRYKGKVVRAGYPVIVPPLSAQSGSLIPRGGTEEHGLYANWGVPIYGCVFDLVYDVPVTAGLTLQDPLSLQPGMTDGSSSFGGLQIGNSGGSFQGIPMPNNNTSYSTSFTTA